MSSCSKAQQCFIPSTTSYQPTHIHFIFSAKLEKQLEKLKLCPDNEILFCKAVKNGKSEILICKTKEQWECVNHEDEDIDKIARILTGTIIKDECNNDVLICQEIKVNDCDTSKESQENKMKEMLRKARIPPKRTKLAVYSSNRLLCQEKCNNNSDKKEIECRIVRVKELIGSPHEISSTQHQLAEENTSKSDCNPNSHG